MGRRLEDNEDPQVYGEAGQYDGNALATTYATITLIWTGRAIRSVA